MSQVFVALVTHDPKPVRTEIMHLASKNEESILFFNAIASLLT